jgi:ketosteroid isomerase-like protein
VSLEVVARGDFPSPSAVLDALLQAIEARSLPATLACFALQANPTVLGSESGEVGRGREAVEAFFRRVYGSSGAYQFDLPNRVLATHGDVAWMVAEGTVVEPTGAAAKPYRLTAVFIRIDTGWRIALWSGSEPVRA